MLKEHRYSVLLVSSSLKFNQKITNLLSSGIYIDLLVSLDIEQSKRLVLERKFDIVIINSPVGSDKGFNFVLSLCDKQEFGILTIVNESDYDEAYFRLHDFGVYILSKPFEDELLIQTLRILSLTRDKINEMNKNSLSFKDELDEINIVAEAKVLIVKKLHITENEAHKLIYQNAMNLRITKKNSALMFIKKYQN